MASDPRETVLAIWRAGVDAVGGYAAVSAALNQGAHDTVPDRILAVGKAAGEMARAALDRYGGLPALVVTKDGHGTNLPAEVDLIEASHPVPDDRSLRAGQALRRTVAAMAPGTTLLLLVSGGASSLAEDLTEGHDLGDLERLNTALLSQGLDIAAMNAQRRKISRIKGGGLLDGFRGAQVRVLAISDVPGDDLNVIGSGIGAAPVGHDFVFRADIVASNSVARAASEKAARDLGIPIIGNAETLHDDLPALASRIGRQLRSMTPGVLILGGEPTVVLPPDPGRGGRNQALALALAKEISGLDHLVVAVGGTDGTDGPTDAAGGIIDGSIWRDGAAQALIAADSGTYLAAQGALLVTGPTGTNVMDLLIALRT